MIATKPQTRTVSADYVFPSPEAWLANHEAIVRVGETPIPPTTKAELMLAEKEGLLEIYQHWLPRERDLEWMDLPAHFGKPVEPFDELYRERLLATLTSDDTFRAAVSHMLSGGA